MELKKQQRWREAAVFRQIHEANPTAFTATQWAHCLRKQGAVKAREAFQVAKEARRQWPQNQWLTREYVWEIYYGYLRAPGESAEEEETDDEVTPEFDVMVKGARKILEVSDEELPLRLAVFAICKAAKQRSQWRTILEFARQLAPDQLSTEKGEVEGHSMPSDRLRWYYLASRALLGDEQSDECLVVTDRGLKDFPDDLFLQ